MKNAVFEGQGVLISTSLLPQFVIHFLESGDFAEGG